MQQMWISFQVPVQLAIKARVMASKQNLSRSALLRRALVEFIDKSEKLSETPQRDASLVKTKNNV